MKDDSFAPWGFLPSFSHRLLKCDREKSVLLAKKMNFGY